MFCFLISCLRISNIYMYEGKPHKKTAIVKIVAFSKQIDKETNDGIFTTISSGLIGAGLNPRNSPVGWPRNFSATSGRRTRTPG